MCPGTGETVGRRSRPFPNEPMARPGLSVAQSSPNVVYLITEFPTAGTLFRSDDYGESWQMVSDDRNLNFRPFYYSDVFADPSDANTVYTLAGGLSKSTDGGRTFQRIASGVHGDHQAIWIDPADGEHVLSGSDGGFQVSFDGGINFHIWRNVDLSQFYHIFVDDRDPYWVCGGLQDNGNWCGPSMTRGGLHPGGRVVHGERRGRILHRSGPGAALAGLLQRPGRVLPHHRHPLRPDPLHRAPPLDGGLPGAEHGSGPVPLQLGRPHPHLPPRSLRGLLGRERPLPEPRLRLLLGDHQPRPHHRRPGEAAGLRR